MLPFDAMHKVTGEVIKNIKMTNMMAISEVDELSNRMILWID
jgi:hypothetical protein